MFGDRNTTLNDKFLSMIGLIISEFSYIEFIVEDLIWRLGEIKPTVGASITTHMGISPKIDALKTLANREIHDEDALELTIKTADKIKAIAPRRNDLVHNPWGHKDSQNSMTCYIPKARGKLVINGWNYTLEELNDLQRQVSALAQDLLQVEKMLGISD